MFQLSGQSATERFDLREDKADGRIRRKRCFDLCIMSVHDYVVVVEEVHESPISHGPSDIANHTGNTSGRAGIFYVIYPRVSETSNHLFRGTFGTVVNNKDLDGRNHAAEAHWISLRPVRLDGER